jgi:hypothetical protein
VAYGTFVLADHLTETQSDAKYVEVAGDTMTGDLDVGGTVTADGLTVQNGSNAGITFDLTTNYTPVIKPAQAVSDLYMEAVGGGGFKVSTSSSDRLFIQNNGDISFYEDTGTTPKFFWDASFEGVGIGTTTMSRKLNIKGDQGIRLFNDAADSYLDIDHGTDGAIIKQAVSTKDILLRGGTASGQLIFETGGSEAMRIDSSGRVGIGVIPENWDTSNTVLAVGSAAFMYGSTNTSLASMGANAYYDSADGRWEYTNSDYASRYQQLDGKHIWSTAPSGTANAALTWSESMRIDANGSIGIGGISPQSNGGASAKVVHTHNSAVGNWAINHWTTGSTGALGGDGFIAGVIGSDAYLYNYEASDMIFATNSNERLKIDAYGGLTIRSVNTAAAAFGGTNVVNGITALPSTAGTPFVVGRDTGTTRSAHFAGNLKFDNGYGIDFDASSGSGRTSSVLDDYEEGTWTPALRFNQNASGITYSTQDGQYTKIGNMVYVNAIILLTSKGSNTGDATIAGLPFSAGDYLSGTSHENAIIWNYWSNYSDQADPQPKMYASGSNIILWRHVGGTTATNTDFSNTTSMRFSGWYMT